MDDEPAQVALFQIEGPDERGCVGICSAKGRDDWCPSLGPAEQAAELMSQWLAQVDCAERT